MTSITQNISWNLINSTRRLHEANPDGGIIQGCQRNFTCRLGYLGCTVLMPITCALDLIFGAIVAVLSIVTLGSIKNLNKTAKEMTKAGGGLLGNTYASLLLTTNPAAKISEDATGFLNAHVAKPIFKNAQSLSQKDSVIARHVFSRALFCVAAVAAVITRIIDLVIGVLAMIVSFLTLGNYKSVNNLACSGLQVGGIVGDLHKTIVHMINPWAEGC